MLGHEHAAPLMRKQGSGSTPSTMASQFCRTCLPLFPPSVVYGAAKAASSHLTNAPAMEPRRSRWCASKLDLGPARIATRHFFGKALDFFSSPRRRKDACGHGAVYKTAPADPAPPALPEEHRAMPRLFFLASDESSFINGPTNLVVEAPSTGAPATGPSSSRAMSRCARHSIRGA